MRLIGESDGTGASDRPASHPRGSRKVRPALPRPYASAPCTHDSAPGGIATSCASSHTIASSSAIQSTTTPSTRSSRSFAPQHPVARLSDGPC